MFINDSWIEDFERLKLISWVCVEDTKNDYRNLKRCILTPLFNGCTSSTCFKIDEDPKSCASNIQTCSSEMIADKRNWRRCEILVISQLLIYFCR